MSRQQVRMAVASRTAFEALQIEGDDDEEGYESEEEEVSPEPAAEKSTSQPQKPLRPPPQPQAAPSKSLSKRAAKAARKADGSAAPLSQEPQPVTEPDEPAPIASSPSEDSVAPAEPDSMKLPEVDELLNPPPPERGPVIPDMPPAPSPPPPPPIHVPSPDEKPISEQAPAKKEPPPPLPLSKTNGDAHEPAVSSPRTRSPVFSRRRQSSFESTAEGNGRSPRLHGHNRSPGPRTGSLAQKLRERTIGPTTSEQTKKIRSILTRTLTTIIMLGLFFLIMALGTPFVVMLVLVCQALVYREVTALFEMTTAGGRIEGKNASKSDDRWSKTLNWYFFAVTNYFLYGESLIHYFKHVVFADAWLTPFATNHRFISFMLYMIGFIGFVGNLKRQFLRQQFGLFCWVHMSLFLIVCSSHFIVNNILEGLIWFWVPACLVICNDIFAYIWGMSFGRTPLIQLSPKKTVEGFVGAFFTTVLFAYILGTLSMRVDYIVCPGHDLGVTAWDPVACEKNPVFLWRDIPIGEPLITILSFLYRRPVTHVPYAPFQFHSVVLACFASLVAPFGGFFASGFKRAFNIKDFGDSIPGHGGMTDRMDCQFLMGMFTYVYYSTLIRVNHVTPGSVLQTIVSSLSGTEQLELYGELAHYLRTKGLLS